MRVFFGLFFSILLSGCSNTAPTTHGERPIYLSYKTPKGKCYIRYIGSRPIDRICSEGQVLRHSRFDRMQSRDRPMEPHVEALFNVSSPRR